MTAGPPPRRRGERGVGTIGTAAAFLVFMLLMLAAVQILFGLYATSAVTAAAHDAAREVAGYRSTAERCDVAERAEEQFVERLGAYGTAGHAALQWTCNDPDVIRVRVVASHPSVLPPRLRGLLPLAAMDRTIEVRVEEPR